MRFRDISVGVVWGWMSRTTTRQIITINQIFSVQQTLESGCRLGRLFVLQVSIKPNNKFHMYSTSHKYVHHCFILLVWSYRSSLCISVVFLPIVRVCSPVLGKSYVRCQRRNPELWVYRTDTKQKKLRVQLCMVTHDDVIKNGNIFRFTGHLCGKFTGPRWISRTKASDAELWCFVWSSTD